MYLYEKCEKDKISVFSLNPNSEKVTDYKKIEMENINIKKRFYRIENNVSYAPNIFDYDSIDIDDLTFAVKDCWDLFRVKYQILESYDPKYLSELLLLNFYNGDYDNNKIVKVTDYNSRDLKAFKYLLLTKKIYKRNISLKKVISTLDGMISIPKSLYDLKQLSIKNIDEIDMNNIDEQLKLFDFNSEPLCRVDMDTLSNLNKYGLCNNSFTEEALKTDTMILKKVRDMNNK